MIQAVSTRRSRGVGSPGQGASRDSETVGGRPGDAGIADVTELFRAHQLALLMGVDLGTAAAAEHRPPWRGPADGQRRAAGRRATGKLLRTLYGQPARRSQINSVAPLAVDSSGRHLLILAENVYGAITFGRLDSGRFTSLPHQDLSDFPLASGPAWAW
jgi:hypothetical protein